MTENSQLPRIFFITGLGADERAFAFLKIETRFPKVYIAWLKPEKKEPLALYCQRLVKEYGIKNGDVLIGLSFGGIVAVEINRIVTPAFTVLLSSAATRKELPLLYRFAGNTGLYHLLPKSGFNKPGKLKYYLFGLQKPEQRKLFDEIITGADTDFVQWAVCEIVRWKNNQRPENLYKIHGSADRIMPLHKPSVDFIIRGGSHFLTWEKAEEVSVIIQNLLEKFL